MTSNQRLIKGLAIGLAAIIILSMIGALIFVIGFFTNFNDDSEVTYKTYDIKDVSNINVELAASNLTIKNGEVFKIEITDRTEYKVENDTLYIKEKNKIFNKRLYNMIIYLPYGIVYDDIKIKGGAGNISMDKISAKTLSLDLGAGKATIGNIDITNKLVVNGGAGDFKISNGDINKIDIDMGVGNFDINATIIHGGNIDVGVGNLDIDLTDDISNYSFDITKGVGSIKVDGNNVSKGTVGNGPSLIHINGGVGSIKVY